MNRKHQLSIQFFDAKLSFELRSLFDCTRALGRCRFGLTSLDRLDSRRSNSFALGEAKMQRDMQTIDLRALASESSDVHSMLRELEGATIKEAPSNWGARFAPASQKEAPSRWVGRFIASGGKHAPLR